MSRKIVCLLIISASFLLNGYAYKIIEDITIAKGESEIIDTNNFNDVEVRVTHSICILMDIRLKSRLMKHSLKQDRL